MFPAISAHGRSFQTIEGISSSPTGLHPVQKAFMAKDALQCGFCTSGVVVEAVALYEKQKTAGSVPSKDDVEAALCGHLCRCGAYPNITEATLSACKGEFDGGKSVIPSRQDALEKVTGKAAYTVDIRLPNQLVGRVLRSPHAHATIKAIRLEKALGMPGVKAAIALCEPGSRVRYCGQEIAGIAASTFEEAEAALSSIEVDFELLPALNTLQQATAPARRLSIQAPRFPCRLPWKDRHFLHPGMAIAEALFEPI
jgi:xanthine dehydrogenase YagR molybdenum-binding subunit